VAAKLWLGKVWLGTKHALYIFHPSGKSLTLYFQTKPKKKHKQKSYKKPKDKKMKDWPLVKRSFDSHIVRLHTLNFHEVHIP
jgi:hypothetical protein